MAMALASFGVALSALAVLDPAARLVAWPGAALALLSAMRTRSRAVVLLSLLAIVYAIDAVVPSNLAADSKSYFAYLHSALFDHDLDFGNELAAWGAGDLPADSWLRKGVHPVGPALLWSPFYLVAHLYVRLGRAAGRETWAADGLTGPYVRACALGTGLYFVLGLALLFDFLRRRAETRVALIAAVGTVLASPIPYYVAVQPAMAHALVFACAAALLWALGRGEDRPSSAGWLLVGALFGLLVLLRWQAVVAIALVAPFAVRDLARRRVRPGALAGAALVASLAFVPQLLAWKVQYGRWVTLPQGPGYVDWWSPRFVDVLLSADRGLLTWTPIALIGLAGLVAALRPWPLLAAGALGTIALTAWVNGGVRDWTGNDAFGARRFDLVVPLLATGVTMALSVWTRIVERRPWLVPAGVVAALAAWNLGLMRLHATGEFPEAAPLERVSARQAGQLRKAAEGALGVFGYRARNLAYKALVGEYLYENVNLGGTVDLGREDARWLGAGWSTPKAREGSPRFRWALAPEACVVLPLQMSSDLKATMTARAPRRIEDQTFEVRVNGRVASGGRLGADWADVPFTIPGAALVPGENLVCFRFARAWGEEGQQVAAQVARIQLP